MSDSRTIEWLALLGLLALIWAVPSSIIYAACCAAALVLAVRWDAWYLGLVGLYSACMVAVHVMPGPYDAYASENTLMVLKAGVFIIAITWLAVRSWPTNKPSSAEKLVIPIPAASLQIARWLCLLSGLIANISRYSQGVPLFSDQVDIVRQLAREQSNIITGLLSEGWTLGVMLTTASLLIARRRPSLLEISWLLIFALGAFAGASRNTLLTAVVPGVLVGLHFRSFPRLRQPPVVQQRSRRGLVRLGLAGAVAGLFGGLMWFQSQRILNGVGRFERAFQQQFAGDSIRATLASLDLSLSGSFETLSRLVVAGTGGSRTEFTILQGMGAVPRWLGYDPNLYQITSALSEPYYMNTATYLAAPIVDFGLTGGVVASFVLGFIFGAVDRWLIRDRTVAGQLIRYYVIYVAVFSVYEFTPFIQPNWVPVIGVLLLIRTQSLQAEASDITPSISSTDSMMPGRGKRKIARGRSAPHAKAARLADR